MAYSRSEKAVLKAILYSDVFTSPVSKNELWRFLPQDPKITKDEVANALKNLSSKIAHIDDLYCLSGKEAYIVRRKKNAPELIKKLRLTKYAAYVLSHIPTVLFIGLSGGVAAANVEPDDDVDLFVITKKNTLFVTRFFIVVVLEALGLRRKRNDSNPSNKICVNFLIDEAALIWPERLRDFYTAREIAQMSPLFERQGMYRKFLSLNKWSREFFPHADPYRVAFTEPKRYLTIKMLTSIMTIYPFECLMRLLQKGFMKRSRTKEFVSNHVLAFHPHDYRIQTNRQFVKKLKEFQINE